MANKMEQKCEKMTLRGYYENLPEAVHPKTDFVIKVMNECLVSYTTARNWITGMTRPMNPDHVKKLSELTGIAEEDLWN